MAQGFQPGAAALHMASGGAFGFIKSLVTPKPQPPKAPEEKPQTPPQQAAPAPNTIAGYAGMTAMQRREKEAGLKQGGDLQTGKGGHVPGTGQGDKIPAKYEPGEFVVSNAMLEANPGLREQLHAARDAVLAAQGTTPAQADAKNAGVIAKLGAAKGFKPELFFVDGGDDERRRQQVAQIPTGGLRAPAADGSQNTDLSRNVNNGLNALGGMGVMASVPLGMGKAGMSAAPQLASPIAKLGRNAAPDFIAGMGAGSTVSAAPALAKAIPYLPGVNAGLQEGAQANALAGATRAASGAGSALTAADQNQPAAPAASPAPASAAPGGAVFGFYPQLAGGKRTTYDTDNRLRTGVTADGAPAVTQAARAIQGGGAGTRMNATQDPRSTLFQQASAVPGTVAEQSQTASSPDANAPGVQTDVQRGGATAMANPNPNQINVTRQPNGVMSFSGGPNIGKDGSDISYNAGASGFKPSGAGVTVVPGKSIGSASPSTDAALSAARFAAADRGDFSAIRDTYNAHGQSFGGETRESVAADRLKELALSPRGTPGRKAALSMYRDQMAANTAGKAQDEAAKLAQQKLGLDTEELGLKKTAAGFTTRASKQLEDAQSAFANAKTDVEREKAQDTLRALQGKYEKAAPELWDKVQTGVDPATNAPIYSLYNKRTGESPGQQQKTDAPTTKEQYDKLPKGARYTAPDGKILIKG